MAEVVDVAGLGDLHEVLASASLTVAGCAPAGYVALAHEILNDLPMMNQAGQSHGNTATSMDQAPQV